MRRTLKPTAVPSQFMWTTENKYANLRHERLLRRNKTDSSTTENEDFMQAPDIAAEVIIPTPLSADVSTADAMDEIQEPVFVNTGIQTATEPPFNISNFMFDDAGIHYYTGLETHAKFMYVLTTLGSAANNLCYYTHRCDQLSVPNQFL